MSRRRPRTHYYGGNTIERIPDNWEKWIADAVREFAMLGYPLEYKIQQARALLERKDATGVLRARFEEKLAEFRARTPQG